MEHRPLSIQSIRRCVRTLAALYYQRRHRLRRVGRGTPLSPCVSSGCHGEPHPTWRPTSRRGSRRLLTATTATPLVWKGGGQPIGHLLQVATSHSRPQRQRTPMNRSSMAPPAACRH